MRDYIDTLVKGKCHSLCQNRLPGFIPGKPGICGYRREQLYFKEFQRRPVKTLRSVDPSSICSNDFYQKFILQHAPTHPLPRLAGQLPTAPIESILTP